MDVHEQKSSLTKKAFVFMLKGKRAKKEPMNIRGVDTEFTATKRERSLLPVFFFFLSLMLTFHCYLFDLSAENFNRKMI